MRKQTILVLIEPEVKKELRTLAEKERQSMSSFVACLIDERLAEVTNEAE